MAKKKPPVKKQMLKTCPIDPRHIWMADIAWCPYCNKTPQERADWAQRTDWGTKPEAVIRCLVALAKAV